MVNTIVSMSAGGGIKHPGWTQTVARARNQTSILSERPLWACAQVLTVRIFENVSTNLTGISGSYFTSDDVDCTWRSADGCGRPVLCLATYTDGTGPCVPDPPTR